MGASTSSFSSLPSHHRSCNSCDGLSGAWIAPRSATDFVVSSEAALVQGRVPSDAVSHHGVIASWQRRISSSFYDVPPPEFEMDQRDPILDPRVRELTDMVRNNAERAVIAKRSAEMAAHVATTAANAAIAKAQQAAHDAMGHAGGGGSGSGSNNFLGEVAEETPPAPKDAIQEILRSEERATADFFETKIRQKIGTDW